MRGARVVPSPVRAEHLLEARRYDAVGDLDTTVATGMVHTEDLGAGCLVPPAEDTRTGHCRWRGAGVTTHADGLHTVASQDGDDAPGHARNIPLAQDGLPGHLQSVVDAVCELQPRREGLGVHELRLRVVGESVPDDVPRPHCLDEALPFLLRRALQAHAAWAVQVQRDQVRLRHPNVGDFAGRVDGSREVNREVPIDHVVVVSDFGDAVKADVQMVGRNHMDLPSV